ncbi:MAG: hypothetical protein JXA92_09405 [candidate division Zixibacteria bacterium]|nr:hypothetical protein [candidate division Zixibacteria bacterium]
MIYKFDYGDAVLEFVENNGRAFLEAADPADALNKTRELFSQTRNEEVSTLGSDQYLVSFKVDFQYRRGLLKEVVKSIRYISDIKLYREARYIDRYILALLRKETGKPKWLDIDGIKTEIRSLRRAAVVAREIPNIIDFIDWDICIYNYIELNSKEGHKSRVVRRVRAR